MDTKQVEHGFLALPEAEGSWPGVLVIPDVRGLYDHFRELAARLAGEGFAVLAVDLYRRAGPPEISDPGSALRFIDGLSDPEVLADVQAAVDYLAAHPATADRSIGVMGFCMGGQYAILAAASCTGLSACVPFYGMLRYAPGLDPGRKPRSPYDVAARLRCPLLGFYGDEDPLIPLDQIVEFETRLADAPLHGEVHIYEGAGHAFMNDTQPERYRPEAAQDAWPKAVGFLRRQLGGNA